MSTQGRLTVASFNVNGIKARGDVLARWLDDVGPDVVALQEIKCEEAAFPKALAETRGYFLAVHGQKGFNGVALLSRRPIEAVTTGLPGHGEDGQARWLEVRLAGGLIVVSVYAPNGNPAPGPKFDYKLAWFARAHSRLRALLAEERPLILAGDWNVIPERIDAATPEAWLEDALFRPESRAAFRRLLTMGLYDALRLCRPDHPGLYTFWDYQQNAFERNDGIRIDHLVLSPQAADRLLDVWIDTRPRHWQRPSDHTPICAAFAL